MNWSQGYVADVAAHFYRETAPNRIAFAALSVGRSPGVCVPSKAHALKDGIVINDETAAVDFLASAYQLILEEDVPIWRQLGHDA